MTYMKKEYEIHEEKQQMASEPAAVEYVVKHNPIFSTYQMQILDSIARVKSENEIKDIRNLIANYFSEKALDAMDKLCDEGKLSTEQIESWHAAHDRSPYAY